MGKVFTYYWRWINDINKFYNKSFIHQQIIYPNFEFIYIYIKLIQSKLTFYTNILEWYTLVIMEEEKFIFKVF